MADEQVQPEITPDAFEPTGELHSLVTFSPDDIQVRDAAKREIDMRLLPWDMQIDTLLGPEMFRRGAFAGTKPSDVLLMPPNHAAQMGIGQDGRPAMYRPSPAGKAIAFDERDDGPHATFRVARTQAGDETLALAADGIVSGVSAEFYEVPGGTSIQTHNGRRTRIHNRVRLAYVSMTPHPAYGSQAAVLAVRSEPDAPTETPDAIPTVPEGDTPMPETTPAAATNQPEPDETRVMTREGLTVDQARSLITSNEILADRLEKLETRSRQEIVIPGQPEAAVSKRRTGDWMKLALQMMTGERVSDIQVRALADLITSDNVGVVPDSVIRDTLIGIIDPARPFLETTTELPTPDSGLTLTVPVIVTRPTVGIQATEKADITSTPTSITTTGFDAVTVAGGGDISIQLLKRSSPSYLDLYLRLLAEAYAIDADSLAVATLLDAGVTPGTGYINPEDLNIGESWTNAVSVSRLLRPDHIWLSTRAIQEFIDAKASGTNAPLYSNLAADITVGNGARGLISGLTPVYVPGMDGSGADVLIGPRRGFAWSEDGTFTLQVDVPSKAGRDVAIVGILWFAPLYPSAFTSYRFST